MAPRQPRPVHRVRQQRWLSRRRAWQCWRWPGLPHRPHRRRRSVQASPWGPAPRPCASPGACCAGSAQAAAGAGGSRRRPGGRADRRGCALQGRGVGRRVVSVCVHLWWRVGARVGGACGHARASEGLAMLHCSLKAPMRLRWRWRQLTLAAAARACALVMSSAVSTASAFTPTCSRQSPSASASSAAETTRRSTGADARMRCWLPTLLAARARSAAMPKTFTHKSCACAFMPAAMPFQAPGVSPMRSLLMALLAARECSARMPAH